MRITSQNSGSIDIQLESGTKLRIIESGDTIRIVGDDSLIGSSDLHTMKADNFEFWAHQIRNKNKWYFTKVLLIESWGYPND